MTITELTLLRAMVDLINSTAASCLEAGMVGRSEGLTAAAETMLIQLEQMSDLEETVTRKIAAELEAFEALCIWEEEKGRTVSVDLGLVPLRAISAEFGPRGLAIGKGESYGAAALDLVNQLGLKPGGTRV